MLLNLWKLFVARIVIKDRRVEMNESGGKLEDIECLGNWVNTYCTMVIYLLSEWSYNSCKRIPAMKERMEIVTTSIFTVIDRIDRRMNPLKRKRWWYRPVVIWYDLLSSQLIISEGPFHMKNCKNYGMMYLS